MPQLQSGRHIGLSPSPLIAIIQKAMDGIKVHELMAIENCNQLFTHIDVLYYKIKESDDYKEREYFPFSIVPPDDLVPYKSSFNLITIQDELDKWEYCDKNGFIDFLNSQRTENFLNDVFSRVVEVQELLLKQPATLPGLLATWWKLSCHPLQDEQ